MTAVVIALYVIGLFGVYRAYELVSKKAGFGDDAWGIYWVLWFGWSVLMIPIVYVLLV